MKQRCTLCAGPIGAGDLQLQQACPCAHTTDRSPCLRRPRAPVIHPGYRAAVGSSERRESNLDWHQATSAVTSVITPGDRTHAERATKQLPSRPAAPSVRTGLSVGGVTRCSSRRVPCDYEDMPSARPRKSRMYCAISTACVSSAKCPASSRCTSAFGRSLR